MLISEAYETNGFYDEMFGPERSPRAGCGRVAGDLVAMPPAQLVELRARADRMFLRMGVTFNVYGDDAGAERIFPFDPIPRVIDAETWSHLEAGLVQRVRRRGLGALPDARRSQCHSLGASPGWRRPGRPSPDRPTAHRLAPCQPGAQDVFQGSKDPAIPGVACGGGQGVPARTGCTRRGQTAAQGHTSGESGGAVDAGGPSERSTSRELRRALRAPPDPWK
jgi:hypothetical protein